MVKSSINNFNKSKIKKALESIIDVNPNAVYYEIVLIGESNVDYDYYLCPRQKKINQEIKKIEYDAEQ